ncbi:MAG TPA: acyltransferase family protein, partial [Flavobacterium sp.]
KGASNSQIHFFLIIWIFTFFLRIPAFASYVPSIDLAYFGGFMGYVVLGYYLSARTPASAYLWRKIGLLCVVIGFVITSGATLLLSRHFGRFFGQFYIYQTPNVVLMSAGVFLLLKNSVLNNKLWITIRDKVSKHAYGIYLVHVLVLTFLARTGIDWSLVHPIIGVPATALICLVLSWTIVYFIAKLPLGKYVSG